jgi:serine/threonine protein kinase
MSVCGGKAMAASVREGSAYVDTDLGKKRPRSTLPTDMEISQIAKTHLNQNEVCLLMQKMYDASLHWNIKQKQELTISDLYKISITYDKNGKIREKMGWTSDKPFEEGGEKNIRPFVTPTGKKRVILEQKEGGCCKMPPKTPARVALNPYWCFSQPIDTNGEGSFYKGDAPLNRPVLKNLIMKHASEGDLWYFIRREDSSELESNFPNLGLQFLEKLDLLHRSGVAHQDIKPSNLLVHKEAEELELFLTDFGQYSGNLEVRGETGTPGYRAPEGDRAFNFFSIEDIGGFGFKFKNNGQRNTLSYNPKLVDLYSTGLTLFELITKQEFSSEISYWCYYNLHEDEKNHFFDKEEFKLFRQRNIDSFLDQYISSAPEKSLIKVPPFAQVIKGLIQEEPKNRIPLESAITLWKMGLELIKKDS